MKGDGSLFERFFKGRYYPRSHISEAGLDFKPNYVWRRWRIGNGEKVRIDEDNWVPIISGFKPFTTSNSLAPNAKVSNLIDRDLGWWNEEALRMNFASSEVVHIASISLSMRLPKDRLI